MDRAIKFRAWDKRINQMKSVANISFGDDGSALTLMAELAPKGKYYNAIIHEESGILMQFTGLLDKDGKEVYEGDIVEVVESYSDKHLKRFQVVYNQEVCGYFPFAQRFVYGDFSFGDIADKFVVVGNIYENPELLQQK